MNPNAKITKTFTVEEWATICKGILSMAAAVDYKVLSDKDTDHLKLVIDICADLNYEIITESFKNK